MGKPRNTTLLKHSFAYQAAQDLDDSPEADDHKRGNPHYLDEETQKQDRVDTGVGEKEQVCPQHAGNRPARAYHRNRGVRIGQRVAVCGHDPGKEIEHDEPHVAERVLDVVAEYPEVEHVPREVKKAAVQEHGGEHTRHRADRL